MNNIYKIKKSIKTPYVLATLISIPIFADVVMRGLELSVLIMALFFMILFYLITINSLLRKVRITDSSISISGIFGSRTIPIEDITMIDGMVMRNRQFIVLTTAKRNFLIPNSFDNFSSIIEDFITISNQEIVGGGLRYLKDHVVVRKSDITIAWIVVILLVIIILTRYFPH